MTITDKLWSDYFDREAQRQDEEELAIAEQEIALAILKRKLRSTKEAFIEEGVK